MHLDINVKKMGLRHETKQRTNILVQIILYVNIWIKRFVSLELNWYVVKALVFLFSINIITSQPVLQEFYYGDIDYDGRININDIL